MTTLFPETCTSCARIVQRPYWLHYEWSLWLPFCDDCARWQSEGFTAAAAIVQACGIVRFRLIELAQQEEAAR